MRVLLVRREARTLVSAPHRLAYEHHVGVVPRTRPCVAPKVLVCLHVRDDIFPEVELVARRAPALPAGGGAPRGHVFHAVFAYRKNDVASAFPQSPPHYDVRIHPLLDAFAERNGTIAAPVVLQIVVAPLRIRPRIHRLVHPRPLVARTRHRPRTGIKAYLESTRMDVVRQLFHVREQFVGKRTPPRITVRSLAGRLDLPAVVDREVRPAVFAKAQLLHLVRSLLHDLRSHLACECVPRVPSERRSQSNLFANLDREVATSAPLRVFSREGYPVFARLFNRPG